MRLLYLLTLIAPAHTYVAYRRLALMVDMKRHLLLALGLHTFPINLMRDITVLATYSQTFRMCFHHLRRQSSMTSDHDDLDLMDASFSPCIVINSPKRVMICFKLNWVEQGPNT